MLVGEKINHFEANTDETVKTFRELFNVPLNYPDTSIVLVGEMASAERRELHIDGKTEVIELRNLTNRTPNSESKLAVFQYTATKDGYPDVVADSAQDMAILLGSKMTRIRASESRGQVHKGYVITKEFKKQLSNLQGSKNGNN